MEIYAKTLIAPASILYHHVVDLELALNGESSDIDGGCLVDVAIQVDKSVPGVEDDAVVRCGLVDDDTLYVVATSSWADGLKGGGKHRGTEGVAKELAECAWATIDRNVGVGVLARLIVRKLNLENKRSRRCS